MVRDAKSGSVVWVGALFVVVGCGGSQGADAGATPDAMVLRCGAEGAACRIAASAGLCRGDSCARCVDVTDDAACQAAWGTGARCLSGVCQDGCRVDADCSTGLRCTDAHLCVSTTCTATAPEFGTVNGGTTPVLVGPGLTPTWACNAGFALSGTAPSCSASGTFTGPAPTCVPVTCTVAAPVNGTLNGGSTSVVLSVNATASWECDAGYALTGTAPRCESSGMLSGPAPTCAPVRCSVVAPANGTLNGGASPVMLAYDATATWACNSGFLLSGTAPRCGGTGALTGPAPTCEPITCTVPAPANGTIDGGTTPVLLSFNATASWACDAAWVLSGVAPTCSGPNTLSSAAPTCLAAACNDAVDEDGDGFNGFPEDPGCASRADDDEADDCPSGPMCPACANGVDDDGDGFTDFTADPGCLSASGASEVTVCSSMDPLVSYTVGASRTFVGTVNDVDLSCGADGQDVVYRLLLRLPLASLVVDTVGSATPAAVALRRSACTAADLVCGVANAGSDGRASLSNLAAGEYFVLVDDLGTSMPGAFALNVRGEYALGARCDAAFACVHGAACVGPSGTAVCTVTACSDGVDEDGDGFSGFPTEPGCSSLQDTDEVDDCPSGPTCPACSNGLDDDLDTLVDYPNDPHCTSASGLSEGP